MTRVLVVAVDVSGIFRTFRVLSLSRSVYSRISALSSKDKRSRRAVPADFKDVVGENRAVAVVSRTSVSHLIQTETYLSASEFRRLLEARSTVGIFEVTDFMREADWEEWAGDLSASDSEENSAAETESGK